MCMYHTYVSIGLKFICSPIIESKKFSGSLVILELNSIFRTPKSCEDLPSGK